MSETPEIDETGRQLLGTTADTEWVDVTPNEPDAPEMKYKHIMDGAKDEPYAHIVSCGPGTEVGRHFHLEDQWLIVVEGSCTFEGEQLEPYAIQYTDARTPYGPFVAGDDGLSFIVVRPTARDFEATHYL